jgi:hypothetical protein
MPLLVLIALGFPTALTVDIVLGRRGNYPLPALIAWPLRVGGLLAFSGSALVFVVMGVLFYDLRPEPLSKQGPDTVNARRAVEEMFGEEQGSQFRQAYFSSDPTFVGSPYELLRFDFPNEPELLKVLSDRNALTPGSQEGCRGPVGNDWPKWWLPQGTDISRVHRWRGLIVCLDSAHQRAYILRPGH